MYSLSKPRILPRILEELAEERALRLVSFSHDWVHRLESAQGATHVLGYVFDLNSAGSHALAKDKAATSEVLAHLGIPHVEHRLFLDPLEHPFLPSSGSWRAMLDYAERHEFRVVAKPNQGTGGKGVCLVSSPRELECAVHALFRAHRSIALCPFHRVDAEFRVIMLGSHPELAYSKERPTVTGDGASTLAELIVRAVEAGSVPPRFAGAFEEGSLPLSTVPLPGERVSLTWKHNLAEGAFPREVDDPRVFGRLTGLARATTRALGLSVAAVDILQVGEELMVLEVNPGIMMERYALASAEHYERAKDVYRRLLSRALPGGGEVSSRS
jgi:glutathione synthase/RimK-type ligase-like ATP-grasp enzyme